MRIVARLLMLAAIASCGGKSARNEADPPPSGSAIVLRGSELSGSVLDAMRARVPGMIVDTRSGGCPNIMLRGPRSVRNQGNPSIYIDGTLMVDTCVLQSTNSTEVDRVEIYPSGILSHANIQRNPFGVIIIYRTNR